jgi:hypothetical protein
VAAAASQRQAWTTPADVLRLLRRRWQTGTFLTAFAASRGWEPLGVPVRGPTPREIAEHFGDVQIWAAQWQRADPKLLRIEHKRVGGRITGVNTIPCRAWIDSYDQLWALLGVRREVERFTELGEATGKHCPRLLVWLTAHPMQALKLEACWAQILDTVRWVDGCQKPGMYLRQIDVPAVDTKFIEQHRGVLGELLDHQLAAERIDPSVPRSDFTGRYRFRKKPQYVRFRLLGGDIQLGWGSLSELTVRASELTVAPPGVTTVYAVENETTYLAFPAVAGAMVIFGGGYAVSALESLAWLADADLIYWGDIDTHGFAILDRLRQRFPQARSMLMDRLTLLAHRSQWVTEPSPTGGPLDLLDQDEAELYRDLATNMLGKSIRLEQERVRFSAVLAILTELEQQRTSLNRRTGFSL